MNHNALALQSAIGEFNMTDRDVLKRYLVNRELNEEKSYSYRNS